MASSVLGPAVDVACVALRRTQSREQYRAHDYQVCLLEGRRLPRERVDAGLDPETAALRTVREHTGLQGNSAWQLSVYGSPHSTNSHTVSILYAIPVAAASAEETNDGVEFHSLASAMEDEAVEHCDREMLESVDQWLQERHALPFLNPTLLFQGEEGGGAVRAVIENPLFLCQRAPPEDQLVISLNNPTFSSTGHSTLDLHATQA